MKTLGAAVVGTGFIGPVHVEAIRRLGHRVIGILGSSAGKSRAATLRKKFSCTMTERPMIFSPFAAFLADTAGLRY